MSTNPITNAPNVDPRNFVDDIVEVGNVENDLRSFLNGNIEAVVLDDSVIQDYVFKRSRVSKDDKVCTSAFETYEDIGEILDSDIPIKVPSGWESIAWKNYNKKYSNQLENDEVDRRIQEIRTNTDEFDLRDINLREEYLNVPDTDHRDRKIIQKADEYEAALLAYDSDLMRFDYDYLTTPGMM